MTASQALQVNSPNSACPEVKTVSITLARTYARKRVVYLEHLIQITGASHQECYECTHASGWATSTKLTGRGPLLCFCGNDN